MTIREAWFVIDVAGVAVGVVAGLILFVCTQCDEELMGARHPAEVCAGTAGCRAVVLGGTGGDGRGRSCPRRVPVGCWGDWGPWLRRRAGWVGSCPCPEDRWAGRPGSAAASPLPSVRGDGCVVAGDRIAAHSVCDGIDLGCI